MEESEQMVKDFLIKNKIECEYESPVFVIDDNGRPRVWTPDFFLPHLGIYLEVCGKRRSAYKFREEIYSKNKITVIFLHIYKGDIWKGYLIERIEGIHKIRGEIIRNIAN